MFKIIVVSLWKSFASFFRLVLVPGFWCPLAAVEIEGEWMVEPRRLGWRCLAGEKYVVGRNRVDGVQRVEVEGW